LPILFNHLKSMPSPEGFGLRDGMVERAFGLKKALDGAAEHLGQDPKFILVGDLNTMGMNLKDSTYDVSAEEEIARLARRFGRYGMRHLAKTHGTTFNNGSKSSYDPADLDHVFATSNLCFADQGGADVHVGGWALIDDVAERDQWIAEFSDHAPLRFVVRGV
jgi:endonuclease/exonuclease/phosphatase family metal-dependent hydrolase